MNPYASINLPNVINAAGKMTYLGSSTVSDHVAKHMADAAKAFVDIGDLKTRVGELIADITETESACVTSCAAAGIVTAIAASVTGSNLDHIESLPDIKGDRNEVIIQKGHTVHFGANITQMIRLTGASVKEIGTVNNVKNYHLENAITDKTAAIVYVVSHHAVSNEMLSLEEVVKIAQLYDIPVIVDAAAEADLKKYTSIGADLITYSGHKAIGGPTSGILLGKKALIDACQLQDKGITRAMKVGKENILGLFHALKEYAETNPDSKERHYLVKIEELEKMLLNIGQINTQIRWDQTRGIPRLQIIVSQGLDWTAKELISHLEGNEPSIRTRNHLADEGIIQFDPRELKESDLPIIQQVLQQFIMNKETKGVTK